ncbi:uncharacterized protein FOMMEDRAFT_85941 [Fomitiporia mediterranea MF3/22]|uniref:uncharacterized protein n=1 Tax=Fomitiporia mediterranea (strain MF3/22) TaxID=694068 RepID=UPI000440808D|nr:uncharacterized protein FOMMEDRAFT_85941 [Fomitiporia mediterranea MF3/22]EJD03231.1 hypothetical protein FOMMEDRAFT_85941 [Fomitiporia mediterranea MF3/22]
MESYASAIQDSPVGFNEPCDPWTHHDLALEYWERFEQSGEREELEKSIAHDRTALRLRPKGHPDRSESLYNLAVSLSTRYERWGQWEDIDEAIALHRFALELRPKSHPEYSLSLNSLTTSLRTRHKQHGRAEDLEEAIELDRAAFELFPEGHLGRSMSLNSLAISLGTRYKRHGKIEDLEEAIEVHRTALKLCTEGNPDRSMFLNNLANSLRTRFRKHGRTEDLEEAVELDQAALELRPEGHPDLSMSLNSLASSLCTRYEQYGKVEDLEEAVEMHRAALELRPEGDPHRSMFLSSLASSLRNRYKQHGRPEDLEEAIELERATLELCPLGHPRHSLSLNNLADSLSTRYDLHGRTEDLEEAIEMHRAALELRPEGHPERFASLNNFAISLRTQYDLHGRTKDLEEVVELHRTTFKLCSEGHPRRFISLNNLAYSLSARYDRHGRNEDLEEAIELLRTALELRPKDHPSRSVSLDNLAMSLSTRFNRHGRAEDLEEAIEMHRAALGLRPEGHPHRSVSLKNLALSSYARIKERWSMDEFDDCMRLLELAATHQFSGLLDRLLAARRWAELARSHSHNTTIKAYKEIISILQHALTVSPTLTEQHDFLTGKNVYRMLTMEAASYAVEKNELEQAVEILEQGRGLLWSQLRVLRTPLDQLAQMNRELGDRFRKVSHHLENLATSHEALMTGPIRDESGSLRPDDKSRWKSFDELLKLKKQLLNEQQEIIDDIRQVPGFENFLEATPFKILLRAASEGPVVLVNHSKYRCDALIVLAHDNLSVVCVPLDNAFYEDSIGLCNELSDARQRCGAASPDYDEKLRKTLRMLWDRVVSNVVVKLKEVGVPKGTRIWWCPTSVLSALPFHAAGPFEDVDGSIKYLLDDYISSYTPTLDALINARSGGNTGGTKLLVVGDTATLRSTRQEIRNVRNCLGSDKPGTTILLDRRASRRTVMERLQKVTWVHFACHGHLDPKPFNSSFKLSDRELTLLDIIRANVPNAEFAFLSACHTAELFRTGAHDEALHLSAAMQFSGFRSVVGTMWELYDEDGPFFARAVYEHMNECEDGEPRYKKAAAGLRGAAIELRAQEGIPTERWVNFVHIGA